MQLNILNLLELENLIDNFQFLSDVLSGVNINANKLGKEKITPLLIKMLITNLIRMLIQTLFNIIDIIISHLSTEALSALLLVYPLQMMPIFHGLETGI